MILDISGIHYVDPSGAKAIRAIAEEFNELNIPFYIAGTSGKLNYFDVSDHGRS